MRKARKKRGREVPRIIWRVDKEKHGPDDSTALESRARQQSLEEPGFLGQLAVIAERAILARAKRTKDD